MRIWLSILHEKIWYWSIFLFLLKKSFDAGLFYQMWFYPLNVLCLTCSKCEPADWQVFNIFRWNNVSVLQFFITVSSGWDMQAPWPLSWPSELLHRGPNTAFSKSTAVFSMHRVCILVEVGRSNNPEDYHSYQQERMFSPRKSRHICKSTTNMQLAIKLKHAQTRKLL